MSLWSNAWSGLANALGKTEKNGRRACVRAGRRRTRKLALERLETRELLAADPAIGINIERIVDWSPAWTFTDAFKTSREWISHVYNTATGQFTWGDATANGGAVHVDDHGWPTQLNEWTNEQGQLMKQQLGTLMFTGQNGHYPAGMYRAEWEGSGTLVWGHDVRAVETGVTPEGRNFAMLQVTPGNGGIYMRIASMDAANPIRNVRVWLPDYNGQSFARQVWRPGESFSPFHPLFLERLSPFKTLRFMDWSVGSSSDLMHWEDRPEVDDARQSTPWDSAYFQDGVAAEYMIELANELDADAWFVMPHLADDDYVRNFATQVRETLEPGRNIYVEWSNEVWNGAPGFDANRWVQQQMTLPENAGLSFYQIWAREARRDFEIWSQVFVGQTERVTRVLAGFQANSWVTNQVLQNMEGSFDAVACALYTGLHQTQRDLLPADVTGDQIVDILLNESIPRDLGFLRNHKLLADQYSAALGRPIELVTYEGGPHLDARGAPYQQAFYDAGVSPRMYEVYDQLLTGAKDIGLDLFMQFTYTSRPVPTPQGDFGALHWQDQPTEEAPKYRALLDAISGDLYETPVPTVTIAATDASAAEAGRDPAVFTITRTGMPLTGALTVYYTAGGTAVAADYSALSGSVTIPIGAASATVTLTPVDDLLVENPETIALSLSESAGYIMGTPQSATATIADNDVAATRPTVRLEATDPFAAEAGRDPAVFTVYRTGPTTQPLVVYYGGSGTATNGVDFNALTGSVTIAAGASSATITITPIDDTRVENTEVITLVLRAQSAYVIGSPANATISIADNDTPTGLPAVNIAATDAAAAEAGSDPAVFTITRAAGSSLGMPLVVNYRASGTAVAGSDYALLSGSVMIPAGVPSATITVTPIDDAAAEGRETVAIALLAGSAYTLGTQTSAAANIADNDAAALPVLMVIANRDFYYQEYADTRASLEAAGLRVEVAAATRTLATPHANSGQGTSAGTVMPDLALADAHAANYSSVVFVGGWGASSYQYAFSGTYANTAYNGSPATELAVNQLIGDFVRQDKYITGICHGVTVLAWARVDGASPLAGRRVSSYAGGAPTSDVPGSTSTRWHIEQNGATMVASRSIGNPTTATDDVLVDGKLITAENWDSAAQFGRTLADYLIR